MRKAFGIRYDRDTQELTAPIKGNERNNKYKEIIEREKENFETNKIFGAKGEKEPTRQNR